MLPPRRPSNAPPPPVAGGSGARADVARPVAVGVSALGVAAVALAARLVGIERLPVWRDEALTYWVARLKPWGELPEAVAASDLHPPLHTALVKLSLLLGDSELLLRLPTALAGAAAAAPLFAAARILAGTRRGLLAGWIAGLAFAFSGWFVRYAQDARPYALMTLAAALGLYGLARVLTAREDAIARTAWSAWAWVAVGMALMAWSHATGLLGIGAVGCVVLARYGLPSARAARPWLAFAAASALALVAWLPLARSTFAHAEQVGGVFWARPPGWLHAREAWSHLLTLPEWSAAWVAALSLVVALGAAHVARVHGARTSLALLASIAAPPLLTAAVSLAVKPIFVTRIFLHASLGTLVLLACGAAWLLERRRALGLALAAGVIALQVALLAGAERGGHAERPWRELGAFLARDAGPRDAIVVAPRFVVLPLAFYLGVGPERPPLFVGAPEGRFPRRTVADDVTALSGGERELEGELARAESIWLVYYEPDRATIAAVRERVRAERELAAERRLHDGLLCVERYR